MSVDSNSFEIDIIDESEFFYHQGPFLPISVCIDTSDSMEPYVDELKRGLAQFFRDILNNDRMKRTALLQVITFDDDVKIVREFSSVTENSDVLPIVIGEQTNLVDAVRIALDSLSAFKKCLKKEGASYYQPWLILLTDGNQYPENQMGIDEISREVQNLCSNSPPRLHCFPIEVGNNVNRNNLEKFSANGSVLSLKEFTSLFTRLYYGDYRDDKIRFYDEFRHKFRMPYHF